MVGTTASTKWPPVAAELKRKLGKVYCQMKNYFFKAEGGLKRLAEWKADLGYDHIPSGAKITHHHADLAQ